MGRKGRDFLLFLPILLSLLALFSSCAQVSGRINPPETKIETKTQKFGPSGVTIAFSGKDERTPPEKLTYAYWVYRLVEPTEKNAKSDPFTFERKPVLEASSTVAQAALDSQRLKEGQFLFAVVAVNEFGLADESPAEHVFRIDLTPPAPPQVEAILKAGKVKVACDYDDTPEDLAGYAFTALSNNDSRTTEQPIGIWTFPAKLGEVYEIEVYAYDDVGNRSKTATLECDASEDHPPVLLTALPALLGVKTVEIELDYYDDWDSQTQIAIEATISSVALKIKDGRLQINYDQLSEGTNTILLELKDTNKHVHRVQKEAFVDLTPPQIPDELSIQNLSNGYMVSWKKAVEADSYALYGSNDGNDWEQIGTTNDQKLYSPQRFLHFAVSAFDKAGNESHISYPVRTYDEMYSPVISSTIDSIGGNTLLTTLFSPYLIKSHLVIPDSVSLAFERGVEITFVNEGELEIEGELISIPSRTDRYTRFLIQREPNGQPFIKVGKGNVWLEKIIFENPGKNGWLFAMSRNSNILINDAQIKGFETVVCCNSSDSFQITESEVEAENFVVGDSVKNMKITCSAIQAKNGISLNNVQNLFLSETILECGESLMTTSGLSNIKIENSTLLSSRNGIQAQKLTVIELFDSSISASNTALAINGASSLNIRKSKISDSEVGVSAMQSSYVSISESVISGCVRGVQVVNSDLSINDSTFEQNATAVALQGRNAFEQKKVVFTGNDLDISRDEP